MPCCGAPGTPCMKCKEKVTLCPKIVVALYNYNPNQCGYLTLVVNQEYEVIDNSQQDWLKARDCRGNIGLIPRNYVKEKVITCCKAVIALYDYNTNQCGYLTLVKNHEYEVIDDSQQNWWKARDCRGNIGLIPSNYVKEKVTTRLKVVVALYDYTANQCGHLSLVKNQEYEVIDDSQEHWWKVRDSRGNIGLVPSNYVKEKGLLELQKYEWYVNDMSRQRAESLLKQENKEGCFVVRNSSTKGSFTLSLYTKVPHPQVMHYGIKQNDRKQFYISETHCYNSIPDLINFHKQNRGSLVSTLNCSPSAAGPSHNTWEIDRNELVLFEELGSGFFGVVRKGKWRGTIDVAVKMLKEGTMSSEGDFIREAEIMTKLRHTNLVQLYRVCSKTRPIFIVTEYMMYGSLLNHLIRHEQSLMNNQGLLLNMCIQVCRGMEYLESHNYLHRDLAARNCLVGAENIIKVGDFGLTRYVKEDQYIASHGSKFPIKWVPPEVLKDSRFSSKSDVWAFGVLMWEVFTCGKEPYGRLQISEVTERVQNGMILEKPNACYEEVYDVMRMCWAFLPENRPSFQALRGQLVTVSQGVKAN